MATLSHHNHPSLVLGNIVHTGVADLINQIDTCEAQVDTAQDKLNALISFKRSITMTSNELHQMGIDISTMTDKVKQIDNLIGEAANDYMAIKLENENRIAQLRQALSKFQTIQVPESPIDMEKSKIEDMPYFTESLKLDSQYFSFGSNLQDDKLANVEKFIRSSTENIATKSDELTQSVCSQIDNQINNHNICGTLIIVASCTHRNIHVFSPLILDPDKAIRAWNDLKENKIDTDSVRSLSSEKENNESIPLITGAAYGSSFIGMVHILQSQESGTGNLDELKAALDQKLKTGGWLENATGGFGVDKAMLNEVKAFLSTQSVSTHISFVTMGVIPTIKSNELSLSVNKLALPEARNIPKLEVAKDKDTVSSEAEYAKHKALLVNLQNARITNVLTALGETDKEKNSVLNIHSLMQALDNYIGAISKKDHTVGIPIHFYIHPITRSEIIRLWLKKYYPQNT